MSTLRTMRCCWKLSFALGIALLMETASLQADFRRLTSRSRPATTKLKITPVGTTVSTQAGERWRLRLPDGSLVYDDIVSQQRDRA